MGYEKSEELRKLEDQMRDHYRQARDSCIQTAEKIKAAHPESKVLEEFLDELNKPDKVFKKGPICDFCGKSQREVSILIKGTSALICEECVELCVLLIREQRPEFCMGSLDDDLVVEIRKLKRTLGSLEEMVGKARGPLKVDPI